MKTYQTSKIISAHNLCLALQQQLPAKFNAKIFGSTNLNVIENGSSIEIWLPQPYEQYLYKIDIEHNSVNISKSEHYIDDVNSLAMEDVLMDIIIAFIGKDNMEGTTPSTN